MAVVPLHLQRASEGVLFMLRAWSTHFDSVIQDVIHRSGPLEKLMSVPLVKPHTNDLICQGSSAQVKIQDNSGTLRSNQERKEDPQTEVQYFTTCCENLS